MNLHNKTLSLNTIKPVLCASVFASLLTACSSDDEQSDSDNAFVQFYNASNNAPSIYFTVDENLDEDDDDDDFEITFSPLAFADANNRYELEADDYYVELAWQDDADSSSREDLQIIYQQNHKFSKDSIQFFALTGDVQAPQVMSFDIPVIDDDNDNDEELFNIRLLNLHEAMQDIDVYMSKTDETFNEAIALEQLNYGVISDNQKHDQDDYTFYITQAGSDQVLFQSTQAPMQYTSQYIVVVRQNQGAGSSPFAIDMISKYDFMTLQSEGDDSKLRLFNSITEHDLLPDYDHSIDATLRSIKETIAIDNISFGQYSDTYIVSQGDYSIDLLSSSQQHPLLSNHLLTLAENEEKTIFFYLSEENVDHDGDGDVDEDGDGLVDEVEIKINSLAVKTSQSNSIYSHKIEIINLVEDDNFNSVSVYFVQNDELIETSTNYRHISYANASNIELLNNTYTVYAVAKRDSSEILLASQAINLDESSQAMFLLLQQNEQSASGYDMTFANQKESN
ncbi:hypothetical protein [Thalassotalea sp. Y01]|uniref:hypothetical protein n=1 Tax=Thalassotalea sp. Y01 TaxID=2729613 RepID=UPI00145E09F2|nr:hypothetical protein [Thalassotalea sp. Y01]NMP16078.1 hypothetical protein [Thalassotalea sp. Y01]